MDLLILAALWLPLGALAVLIAGLVDRLAHKYKIHDEDAPATFLFVAGPGGLAMSIAALLLVSILAMIARSQMKPLRIVDKLYKIGRGR